MGKVGNAETDHATHTDANPHKGAETSDRDGYGKGIDSQGNPHQEDESHHSDPIIKETFPFHQDRQFFTGPQFFKLEKQRELRAEETRVESKNLGIGARFSRLASVVTAPARNIFDQILDFFGLIALGILVQKLPAIIAKIEEFFNSDFIKSVGNVLTTIGTGFQKLGELINLLTPQKQKEIDQDLKAIEKEADDGLKMADQSDKDISQLEKELSKREKNNKPSSTPNVPMTLMAPGSMYPATTPQSSTSQSSQTPTPAAKPPQKFSKGGTVQPEPQTRAPYQPRKSGQLKRAERGMGNGFEDFSLAVENINQTAQRDEKNVMAFAELSKNFREWSSLSGLSDTRKTGPGFGPQPTPDQQSIRQQQYSGQTYASGASIGPTGDTDGNQTGLDMNLAGGIGAPIYAPFDLIYKSRGTDGMPSVGLQGTPNVLGGSGRGFGYYGAYYFKRGNKEYEVLMGHFKSLPFKGAKEGQVIPKGTLLGYQGASGRTIGAGNQPYPHISLHVNGVGFRASNSVLVDVSKDILKGKPSPGSQPPATAIKPAQIVQPPSGVQLSPAGSGDPVSGAAGNLLKALERPGGGGNRKLLNNTSSRGNQSLFIYAVQPVETFVPFPYPVPMQQASSSSPQRQKLPEIWRL